MKTIVHLLKISLLLLIISACGSIRPEAPDTIVQENYIITEPQLSIIKVPVRINLKPHFDEVEKGIDKKFKGGEQNCDGVSFSYTFLRSPIEFKGVGNKLLFDVDGKYALRLSYCPSCTDLFSSEPYCVVPRIKASCGVDEPMRGMHVGFATEIGVTNDYHLSSTTKLRQVKALSPCKISAFNYNATETLEKEITGALKDVEKDIDSAIREVDLKPEMEELWNLLWEPTDLDGYGSLELSPVGMSVGKITYKEDSAYFDAVLKAKPAIHSTVRDITPTPLPDLSSFEDRDGFDITMDVFTQYDSLSAILTREIGGMKTDVKGKTVIFDSVQIHGASNKKLNIKVSFSGSKSGDFYLVGTPVFDEANQHISFPDLQFDIRSKSALLKSAKWLFSKKITDLLRQESSMDLEPYLTPLKSEIDESLNMELSEGVTMSGKVEKIAIQLIHPLNDQLHIRINSMGTLGIQMD